MLMYRTVVSSRREELDDEVNGLLRTGWKLLGGVSITKDYPTVEGSVFTYAQAMVKDDDGIEYKQQL